MAEEKTKTKHADINHAMVAIQKELRVILKDQEAQAGSRRYKYADLVSVVTHILPIVNKHDCFASHTTFMNNDETMLFLKTVILHAGSGTQIDNTQPLRMSDDIRKFGGDQTYLRRYGLSMALSLVSDEDTDGSGPREKEAPSISEEAYTYILKMQKMDARWKAKELWDAFKGTNPLEVDMKAVADAFKKAWVDLKQTPDKRPEKSAETPEKQEDVSEPLPTKNPEELLAEIETVLENATSMKDLQLLWEKYEIPIQDMVSESDRDVAHDMFSATENRLMKEEGEANGGDN